MDEQVIKQIESEYAGEDLQSALSEISSVTLQHVMANSEENLKNTHLAILKLSRGDLAEMKRLVGCAKEDFRDVIYWATME